VNEPLRVLIVEDNPADVDLVREGFPETGPGAFRVESATRLSAALARLGAGGIDLVLLDLGLPDSQGLDTLRRLRDAAPGIPVIVLTGNVDQAIGLAAVSEGAQDYLVKGEVTGDSIARSTRHALQRSRAEASLRESEERFRSLYENSTIGLYRTTPDGAITLANPALVAMLGFSSADELLARNLEAEGFEPSYSRRQFIERIEREGMVRGVEAVWTRRDGTPLVVRESARAIRDSKGNTLFYDGTVEDVTERRQAQDALAESEVRYRELVKNLNDVIFTLDIDGTITYVSPPVRQVAGYAPEELVGHPFREIIDPDDLTGLDRRFREILQDRIEPWEFRYRTKDGQVRWARTSSRPLYEGERPIGITGVLSDITPRKQAELSRDRLLQRFVTLNHVALALGQLAQLPAILRTLHDEVRTLLDADGFFVSRYAKDSGLITALFAVDEGRELDVSTFPPVPLAPEGRGMQSQVLRTGKPLNVPDWLEGERRMQTVHHIKADGTFTPPPPETERENCTKSALLVPMMYMGKPIGVLQVQSNQLEAYTDEDVDLLTGLANVAAVSVQNALLIEEAKDASNQLRLSLEGALRAVSRASETRDPYTAGHQYRVTDLAVAIAHELGLLNQQCDTLRAAGLTHDIGKLGIPAEILSKPGTLSPIEFDLIREHPQTSHDILADVPFPGPVAEIVLQHHERLDGSGYPRGLKGDGILREARILAVADVVEAMASHRPYRPTLGIDAALGEIEQSAGRLYDPEAVQACVHLFRDKGYALPT
jgi:PAS domain S-box-containing protein